mmetsp:Transcript_11211/g.17019  ORF Transcript_11211/g.17019 Transcript_11211/m.17019 type:complete len:168 (-) Transcript_11211:3-506(-)
MGKGKQRVRVKQVGPKNPAAANPLAGLAVPPEDLIQPPRRGDPSATIPWPITVSAMDTSTFITIYPTYIDSTKTLKQGRRLPAAQSVPSPCILDLSDACRSLSLRHVVQPWKGFSRDVESRWYNPGRVKVDLSSANAATKLEMLKEIALTIPLMASRKKRVEEKKLH